MDDGPDGFSTEDWKLIKQIEPFATPMPSNPFNKADDNIELDEKRAELGQMLFFETELAEAITVAGPAGKMGDKAKVGCVTCHDTKFFSDSRPGRVSHGRNYLSRNTGAMVNLGYYQWTLSTGRFDSMVDHGAGVWGTSATPLAYSRYLFKKYAAEYNAAFPNETLNDRLGLDPTDPESVFPATGGPKANAMAADGPYEKMPVDAQMHIQEIRANLGRVFDSYPRRLTTPGSPFQRYVTNKEFTALNPQAVRGLKLFIGKAACNDCHTGPTLTDNKFHNVGIKDPTSFPGTDVKPAPDRGRGSVMVTILNNLAAVLADPAAKPPVFNGASSYSDDPFTGKARLEVLRLQDEQHCVARLDPMVPTSPCTAYDSTLDGVFRTPSLLNVAETGPYFHSGEISTLENVVQHYNKGGSEPGSFVGTKSPRLRPLGLTDEEVSDLVAFLKSLTGVAPIDNLDPNISRWARNIAKPALPIPPVTPPAAP